MSENAVPDPWDAVVMPTDCAGVASTSLGMVVPAAVWSPAVVMVAPAAVLEVISPTGKKFWARKRVATLGT